MLDVITLLLNRDLVERNYVLLVFSQILSNIVLKIRNLPKIFLRSFENVTRGFHPAVQNL